MSAQKAKFVPCLYNLKQDVPGSWWKKGEEVLSIRIKCGNDHISEISEDQVTADGEVESFICPEKDCDYEGAIELVDYR